MCITILCSAVPEPSVTLQVLDTTDAKSKTFFVGEDITLTCDIQLSEVLIVDVNVTVMVEWYRNGSRLSDSTQISISTTTAGSSEVLSRLSFRSVVTVGYTTVQPSSLLYREHLLLSQVSNTGN